MTTNLDGSTSQWLETVQQWANKVLVEHGVKPVGKLEPVSGWALGQIFKQQTNKGVYFFKSTAFLPLFSNESQVCKTLSTLLPDYVPDILSASQSKQWMLSADFGGGLAENTDKAIWAEAFKSFATFQSESIKHISALKLSGCLYRPIANIPPQLNELLNDSAITRSLPVEVVTNKHNIISSVTKAIAELTRFNIPNTLVHGDLHIENIAINKGKYIFFDWSDACISHPFIDGTYIFRMPESVEKQKIVRAYLSQWLHLGDYETLLKAWQQAELVCYAHQTISYGSMKKVLSEEQMQDLKQAFINAFNRLVTTSTPT